MGLKSWASVRLARKVFREIEKEYPMLGSVVGWLNGKKTVLGGCLTIASEVLIQLAPMLSGTVAAKYVGLGLMSVGLIHKAWKKLADLDILDDFEPPALMVPILALGLMVPLMGCGADLLKPAADPVASPSPEPTPDLACIPDTGLIQATRKGAPNVPIYAWGQGQEVRLHHKLFNSSGEALDADCGVSLRTVWTIRGDAFCSAYGSVETADIVAACLGVGDVFVDATRANVEASAVFRVFATEAEAEAFNRARRIGGAR